METKLLKILFLIIIISRLTSAYTCGHAINLHSKIVGGKPVQDVMYPWFTVLGRNADTKTPLLQCGASLITKTNVISAAHCLSFLQSNNNVTKVAVYFGVLNVCQHLHNANKISIEKYVIHPEYKSSNYFNDIAIITLQSQVHYEPICLPDPSCELPSLGNVIGFGASISLNITCELQGVNISVYDKETCKKLVKGYQNFLEDGVICAGDMAGGKDSCSGDSGGPLQYPNKNEQYIIYGIVSFGYECALPNTLAGYVDVKYYIEWILSNVEQKVELWCIN